MSDWLTAWFGYWSLSQYISSNLIFTFPLCWKSHTGITIWKTRKLFFAFGMVSFCTSYRGLTKFRHCNCHLNHWTIHSTPVSLSVSLSEETRIAKTLLVLNKTSSAISHRVTAHKKTSTLCRCVVRQWNGRQGNGFVTSFAGSSFKIRQGKIILFFPSVSKTKCNIVN